MTDRKHPILIDKEITMICPSCNGTLSGALLPGTNFLIASHKLRYGTTEELMEKVTNKDRCGFPKVFCLEDTTASEHIAITKSDKHNIRNSKQQHSQKSKTQIEKQNLSQIHITSSRDWHHS